MDLVSRRWQTASSDFSVFEIWGHIPSISLLSAPLSRKSDRHSIFFRKLGAYNPSKALPSAPLSIMSDRHPIRNRSPTSSERLSAPPPYDEVQRAAPQNVTDIDETPCPSYEVSLIVNIFCLFLLSYFGNFSRQHCNPSLPPMLTEHFALLFQ